MSPSLLFPWTVSRQLGFYAAGYLEGYVTSQSLCDFSYDFSQSAFDGNATQRDEVLNFLYKVCWWDYYFAAHSLRTG